MNSTRGLSLLAGAIVSSLIACGGFTGEAPADPGGDGAANPSPPAPPPSRTAPGAGSRSGGAFRSISGGVWSSGSAAFTYRHSAPLMVALVIEPDATVLSWACSTRVVARSS